MHNLCTECGKPLLVRYDLKREIWQNRLDPSGNVMKDANGLSVRELVPGTEQSWGANGNSLQTIGKLSFSPNADHQLSFTSIATPGTMTSPTRRS